MKLCLFNFPHEAISSLYFYAGLGAKEVISPYAGIGRARDVGEARAAVFI